MWEGDHPFVLHFSVFFHVHLSPVEKNVYLGSLVIIILFIFGFASSARVHSPGLLSRFADEL